PRFVDGASFALTNCSRLSFISGGAFLRLHQTQPGLRLVTLYASIPAYGTRALLPARSLSDRYGSSFSLAENPKSWHLVTSATKRTLEMAKHNQIVKRAVAVVNRPGCFRASSDRAN